MKRYMKHATAVWVALAVGGVAQARDLVQVYDDAVQFDPQIAGANATRLAAREASPQALAALLPPVSGNFQPSRAKQQSASVEPYPSPTNPPELVALPYTVGG